MSKIPKHAEKVFQGEIFSIYQWQQKLFDGSFATFEMAQRYGTALVIPILENGNILIAKQEQPDRGEYIDFLGGRQDSGETLLETAQRELFEEAGLEAKKLECFYTENPGGSKLDWEISYYIASGCKKVSEQKLDAGEKLEVLEISIEDFLNKNFENGLLGSDFSHMIDIIKDNKNILPLFKK